MTIKLMQHQSNAVELLAKNKGIGALFWEVGTGKTIGSLAMYEKLKSDNLPLKMLVICPLSLIEGAWIKEIGKFMPDAWWYDWHGDQSNFKGHINKNGIDIHIVNFEYLLSEKKFLELKSFMKWHHWMCVIDESSKMKNHQAKTTIRILELKSLCCHRIICSGTPAPNSEMEYFSQMLFLDARILGDNFFKFKNTCFALRRGKQVANGNYMNKATLREMFKTGFKYEIIPARREEMFKRMQPFCDFVRARDCMDLPDEVDEYRIIEMGAEQRKIYNQMKEFFVAEIKKEIFLDIKTENHFGENTLANIIVANMILTKLMKLRQITSGFAIDERQTPINFLKTNPKMEALKDIIEEAGNEQIIIWGQFHHEIEEIVSILKETGGGVSVLYGKTPQADRIEHIDSFIGGKNRFLVAHPDSAAHGLTFTNCHMQIFYSLSYSLEEYLQSRGRTMRYGQKNNCLYFHILAKNSIDEDILGILQKKTDKQQVAEKYLKG